MCGKNTNLFRTIIEGADLNVCKECGGHGKVLSAVKTKEEVRIEEQRVKDFLERKKAPKEAESEDRVVDNYSLIIHSKRQKLGLTQEEFAKRLNEKESLIHHIEQGKFCPPISLARKFEKMLGITLVEEVKNEVKFEKSSAAGLTIGDLLNNIKKK